MVCHILNYPSQYFKQKVSNKAGQNQNVAHLVM